jgi:hypothetical protein
MLLYPTGCPKASAISVPGGSSPGVSTGLSQSVPAHVGKVMLIAIPAGADQLLELFWRQLLAGGLPLQLSDDLLHAGQSPESARSACSLRATMACSPGTMLGLGPRALASRAEHRHSGVHEQKSKAEIDDWLQGSLRIDWLRSQGYAK